VVLDEGPLSARSLIEVMDLGRALMVLLLEVDWRKELGIGGYKLVSMM
jgi:hypothetical protein